MMRWKQITAIFLSTYTLAAEIPRPRGIRIPVELNAAAEGDFQIVPAFPSLRFSGKPLFLTHAGDNSDRVFVVEQRGRILVFPNRENITNRDVKIFADLRDVIGCDGRDGSEKNDRCDRLEMGLLGLAFAPDYATSREFYVAYTNSSRALVVSRLKSQNEVAEVRSLEPLISVPKFGTRTFSNHNGGMIAFGPHDRMLYIGTGDGGGAGDEDGNSQKKSRLLGKILRIDPHGRGARTYKIPADNPFVNEPNARPEIWVYGIRNPWRFAFDRADAKLYLADVGQGAREEINILQPGGNYGWNVWEGSIRYPQGLSPEAGENYLRPFYEYERNLGGSITGGYVYRGTRVPALLGHYLYADYISGNVWALDVRTKKNLTIGRLPDVNSFGEDEKGEIYLISRSRNALFKVESTSGGGVRVELPRFLSQTGIFQGAVKDLKATDGVLEYSVNTALWSDGAEKRRWLVMPATGKIDFQAAEAWSFPVGTILVKHFEIETTAGLKKLETRLLVHHKIGTQSSWRGYTYRWRTEQDAELIADAETEELLVRDPKTPNGHRRQTWLYPSRSNCMTCHTEGAGVVLGVRTEQLHRPLTTGSDNQLATWLEAGFIQRIDNALKDLPRYAALDDVSAPLDLRARSYLAVNCAHCHSPQNTAPGGIDLRFSATLAQTALLERAGSGDMGLANPHRVLPGSKDESILWLRMKSSDPSFRMPKLATSVEDRVALDVVGQWIDSLRP